MGDIKVVKKDLTILEKLKYIKNILKYSKKMTNWRIITCDTCYCTELEKLGNTTYLDDDWVEQKYKCMKCGSIGVIRQRWS